MQVLHGVFFFNTIMVCMITACIIQFQFMLLRLCDCMGGLLCTKLQGKGMHWNNYLVQKFVDFLKVHLLGMI